jgi:hypothetical protein
MSLDVRWCETWYVNLFGLKFGKMKVLKWPLSRKWNVSLCGYKFDKQWTCPSMSLDAKHDMWTYLVWNSVKWKYWNDPCRENEMLAYVVRILINSELVPRCSLMRNMICELIWFYIRKNESIGITLSQKWDFSLIWLEVW